MNCLVKQFAICLGVFAILLLNVMDLLSVVGHALLDRPCMVFQRMCILCLRVKACNLYASCPLVCCAGLPSV